MLEFLGFGCGFGHYKYKMGRVNPAHLLFRLKSSLTQICVWAFFSCQGMGRANLLYASTCLLALAGNRVQVGHADVPKLSEDSKVQT